MYPPGSDIVFSPKFTYFSKPRFQVNSFWNELFSFHNFKLYLQRKILS